MLWIYATVLSTIFFVIGQVFLKLAVMNPSIVAYWFSLGVGILGVLGMIYTYKFSPDGFSKTHRNAILLAFSAGMLFFIGNILWIYAIQNAPNIAYVYSIMTGIISISLLIISFYLFHQSIEWIHIVGILVILFGIYLVVYPHAKK